MTDKSFSMLVAEQCKAEGLECDIDLEEVPNFDEVVIRDGDKEALLLINRIDGDVYMSWPRRREYYFQQFMELLKSEQWKSKMFG